MRSVGRTPGAREARARRGEQRRRGGRRVPRPRGSRRSVRKAERPRRSPRRARSSYGRAGRTLGRVRRAQPVGEEVARARDAEGHPGLVGATPMQNVGAYGQEVADTITRVRGFDCVEGKFVDDGLARAGSATVRAFQRSARWIVPSGRFVFALRRRGADRLPGASRGPWAAGSRGTFARDASDTVLALRRGKGTAVDPADPESVSAGSFFVNPVVGAAALADVEARAGERPPFFEAGAGRFKLAAAWLVERAGFPRGWGRGRVGVSRKHALALVNRGGATARMSCSRPLAHPRRSPGALRRRARSRARAGGLLMARRRSVGRGAPPPRRFRGRGRARRAPSGLARRGR